MNVMEARAVAAAALEMARGLRTILGHARPELERAPSLPLARVCDVALGLLEKYGFASE